MHQFRLFKHHTHAVNITNMDDVAHEQARETHRQVKAVERTLTAMQQVHASIRAYCSAPTIGEFGEADAATPPAHPPDACAPTTHSPLQRFMGSTYTPAGAPC